METWDQDLQGMCYKFFHPAFFDHVFSSCQPIGHGQTAYTTFRPDFANPFLLLITCDIDFKFLGSIELRLQNARGEDCVHERSQWGLAQVFRGN